MLLCGSSHSTKPPKHRYFEYSYLIKFFCIVGIEVRAVDHCGRGPGRLWCLEGLFAMLWGCFLAQWKTFLQDFDRFSLFLAHCKARKLFWPINVAQAAASEARYYDPRFPFKFCLWILLPESLQSAYLCLSMVLVSRVAWFLNGQALVKWLTNRIGSKRWWSKLVIYW